MRHDRIWAYWRVGVWATDQIRRSSRSVCANISEAWRKRRYFFNGNEE
ncbi:MAG: four helix bundle protein [Chitinispirillaceae bacterium]|nr:four helix bundle protein [Chitinispirillaceae bacterium]